jgi:predicted RNA-binding Zn-ribbon protein involved in translation (DUF1610 family)
MAEVACPECGEHVPLADARNGPGGKTFECSNGHVFGPGAPPKEPPSA